MLLAKALINSLCNNHPIDLTGTVKFLVNTWCYCIARFSVLRKKASIELTRVLIRIPFKLTSYPFYSKSLDAVMFFYDADSYTILFGDHEPFILKSFTPSPGDVVVDVGAHLGKYTIFFSKRVGKQGKVIAIEAYPKNYKYLIKNVNVNSAQNVIPVNVAVDKVNGFKALYVAVESGWHSLDPVLLNKSALAGTIRVETKKLDTIVKDQRLHRIDLVKIDVEGSEYGVLSGAIRSLKVFRPKILIEIHSKNAGVKVTNLLRKMGYELTVVYGVPSTGRYYLVAEWPS